MKPEPDPVTCESGDCRRQATNATPAGPMCDEHAEEVAEAIRRDNERYNTPVKTENKEETDDR